MTSQAILQAGNFEILLLPLRMDFISGKEVKYAFSLC